MGHVKVNSQGQQIVVNADSNNAATGAEIKRQSSIPQDRVLTYVDEEGRTRAIADHEQVQLHEGMNIGQAPRFRYGAVPPWFCRCGQINLPTDVKCSRCGLARSLGERRLR